MTVPRKCSRRVIERQPKNGAWFTVLSCGHKHVVQHRRDYHVCYECQQQHKQKQSVKHLWTLQTMSGLILVKKRMFKLESQVKLDEIECFPNKRSAEMYAKLLTISVSLQAVKLQQLTVEAVA